MEEDSYRVYCALTCAAFLLPRCWISNDVSITCSWIWPRIKRKMMDGCSFHLLKLFGLGSSICWMTWFSQAIAVRWIASCFLPKLFFSFLVYGWPILYCFIAAKAAIAWHLQLCSLIIIIWILLHDSTYPPKKHWLLGYGKLCSPWFCIRLGIGSTSLKVHLQVNSLLWKLDSHECLQLAKLLFTAQ